MLGRFDVVMYKVFYIVRVLGRYLAWALLLVFFEFKVYGICRKGYGEVVEV